MPPLPYSICVTLSRFALMLFSYFFSPPFFSTKHAPFLRRVFGLLSLNPPPPPPSLPPPSLLILALRGNQWSIKSRSDPVRNSLGERLTQGKREVQVILHLWVSEDKKAPGEIHKKKRKDRGGKRISCTKHQWTVKKKEEERGFFNSARSVLKL